MLLISRFNRTSQYSEKQVLEALTQKGADASEVIRYLYRRVKPIILSQVNQSRFPEPEEVCKDIVQDGLLILIEKLRTGDLKLSSSVASYLIGICKHIWRQRQRDHFRSGEVPLDPEAMDQPTPDFVARYLSEKDQREGIRRLFAMLPEKCGAVLRLVYWNRFDMESIASKLGYKNGNTVKNTKRNCLKKLIEYLQDNPQFLDLFQP